MRILLVSSQRLEREAQVKLLEARHHHVEQAHDYKTAMHHLENAFFEVLVLDYALLGSAAFEILKRLRAMPELPMPYVVVASERNPGPDFDKLYAEGMDDFLRKPCWHEELIARVEAPARGKRRHGTSPRDWTQRKNPLASVDWSQMAGVLGGELTELSGHPFDCAVGPKHPPPLGMAARIALVAAASDTEIRVTIGADHGSLFKLAEIMLGATQTEQEMLEDLLREIANTTAGALKRVAPQDEALTTGLPVTMAMVDTLVSFDTAPQRFALRMKGQPIELSCAIESLCRGKHLVPASDLKEGMVLVRDLRNDSGLLLVPSGTRLTSSAAARVSRLLGNDHLVEISAAA